MDILQSLLDRKLYSATRLPVQLNFIHLEKQTHTLWDGVSVSAGAAAGKQYLQASPLDCPMHSLYHTVKFLQPHRQ